MVGQTFDELGIHGLRADIVAAQHVLVTLPLDDGNHSNQSDISGYDCVGKNISNDA